MIQLFNRNIIFFVIVIGLCFASNNLKAQCEKKVPTSLNNNTILSKHQNDSLKMHSDSLYSKKIKGKDNFGTNKNSSSESKIIIEDQSKYMKKTSLIKMGK
jgi:uncharacterized membrane protein